MLDAVEELSDLSEALQKGDITLTRATKLISRQVEIFTSRKTVSGMYYKQASDASNAGIFSRRTTT